MTQQTGSSDSAYQVGSDLELFVDHHLIDRMFGAELLLHHPAPQEVSLVCDQSWEGNACGHFTVFRDGDIYKMYYRGADTIYRTGERAEMPKPRVVCYAESADGLNWTRPPLGLVEFEGSKDNNIVWEGEGSNNFVPFKDANPDAEPDALYKAIMVVPPLEDVGRPRGIVPLKSPDGLRWTRMTEQPVITKGWFDSHNLAFWDALRGEYREYHRQFRDYPNGRDIMTGTSKDFLNWTDPVWLGYSPGRTSELYTNGVIPYYRAPHIFLGFPTRYEDRGWTPSAEELPQLDYRRVRSSGNMREGTAVTDGMFMSSRDGLNFDIWPESFIRPGLRARDGWFYGDNYQNWGIVETESAIQGAQRELSFYVTEAAHQPDTPKRLRRHSLRIDGFVSVHAKLVGGEVLTKPIVHAGGELVLNVSTSAAGSVRVELQDEGGEPLAGFGLDDCSEIYGDEIDRTVRWEGGVDVSTLAGRPVRMRLVLKDADVYSFQFR